MAVINTDLHSLRAAFEPDASPMGPGGDRHLVPVAALQLGDLLAVGAPQTLRLRRRRLEVLFQPFNLRTGDGGGAWGWRGGVRKLEDRIREIGKPRTEEGGSRVVWCPGILRS